MNKLVSNTSSWAVPLWLSDPTYKTVRIFVSLLMVVEVVLLALIVIAYFDMPHAGILYVAIGVLLVLTSLGVDCYLMHSVDRFVQRSNEKMRAAMLERELDNYLKSYDEVVKNIEATARVRHDLGNQMIVLHDLIARGEYEHARMSIESLLDYLDSLEESGERAC